MSKKYYLWILGCQMNKADGERVAAILDNLDYQQTAIEAEADLIVTLACSVRQSAIDRIYGKARVWHHWKKERALTTVLTGCILPTDRLKMHGIFDLIFDIKNLSDLPAFLGSDDLPAHQSFSDGGSRRLPGNPRYTNSFQAFVPISNGCNNYCSYCVVPYVRGPEKSRNSQEIIDECKILIDRGFKEITLLGQNVNSYGLDLTNDLTFPQLLKKINDLSGNFWLRFMTSHPKDMNDELIEVVAQGQKICEYLHLPAQSGDNEILKKMNRNYTKEDYLKLADKIRKKIPGAAISTDVIVGFPGETKKQFKNTVKLFKEAKFAMAYIAQYSPRTGTVAYQLKDDVPKAEKQKREEMLNELLKKTALKNNKNLVGQIVEVLVEERKSDYLYGRTRTYKNIRFALPKEVQIPKVADNLVVSFDFIGKFVKIKVTKANSFNLEGILKK